MKTTRTTLKVGDVVEVGPRFVMGERLGQGHMEPDEWTGRKMRIVDIRWSEIGGHFDADLATADIEDADAEVTIITSRLSEPVRRPAIVGQSLSALVGR
jgi:hypothetical protein